MSEVSSRLELPYLLPSQAQKHVTHNEALQRLDGLVQLTLMSFDADTPPGPPNDGDAHFVGSSPTGAWLGQAGMLAIWDNTNWTFTAPLAGWLAWDVGNQAFVVFDGSSWQDLPVILENVSGIGIQSTSDATNRLSVSSDASLFSHAGAGHQFKINKASAGDTASLLYQSNWTGHAEIGLAGDTDLSIKTSANGSTWFESLRFESGTGLVTGQAVQNAADDVTPGRLMRTDYGYSRGNVVGTVSETAGLPTGAVIERASTANGTYIRFADGTQICTYTGTLAYDAANRLEYSWTYPAAFAAGSTPAISTNLINEYGATPGPDEFGLFGGRFGGAGMPETMVDIRLYRMSGATNFLAGDTLQFSATAIGRWF
ncbi:DUF2793 domain-containing protein [Aestuariibius sp. HNIBRBA575]|uniref:DUF2793 domain-containing protein n=1 Tax=Aestuariibius sp. HNIBRBA575 TaxID=3233343 RepID=UPI0034A4CED4